MKQKVTCPETGHLEEIDVTQDPVDGHIVGVHRCSRWPDGRTDCAQTCAHRLNQRLPNIMRRERVARTEEHARREEDDDGTG
jgi:ribosomal protein S4